MHAAAHACVNAGISEALFRLLPVNSVNEKKSHRMLGYMYGVLNAVYLQNFLYGWAVNRETNLMSILNI